MIRSQTQRLRCHCANFRFFITLVVLVPLALSYSPASYASKKKPYTFRLDAGVFEGTYSDITESQSKSTEGKTEPYKLSGSSVNLGLRIGRYEFEVDSKTLTPKENAYLDSRSEFYFHFIAFPDFFPYLGPSFGYYSLTQSGSSKTDITDPFSFLDKNTAFVLGANAFFPWDIGKKHQIFLTGKYLYLTTFEADKNFGNENQLGLGYVYKMDGMPIGIKLSSTHQFYHAKRPEEDNEDLLSRVRSILRFQALTLHLRF